MWEITGHCSTEIQGDCSFQIPTSPGSPHKCESVMKWPPLDKTPAILMSAIVPSEPLWPLTSWKPEVGRDGAFRPRLWWRYAYKAIVHPILNYADLKWCRTRSWAMQPAATKMSRCHTSEQTLGFSLEGSRGTVFIVDLSKHPLTRWPQSPHRHLPRISSTQGNPPGLLPPNSQWPASQRKRFQRPHCHLKKVIREGSSLARRLFESPDDWGSQQRALGYLPPVYTAELLLPRFFKTVLFQLLSGCCVRLQSYRHSVGWAAQFLLGLTQFADMPPLQIDFDSFPS